MSTNNIFRMAAEQTVGNRDSTVLSITDYGLIWDCCVQAGSGCIICFYYVAIGLSTSTSCPPTVIHAINSARPSLFSPLFHFVYYCQHKLKNETQDRTGNEAIRNV